MDNKTIFASNLQKYMDLNRKTRRDLSEALDISYYTVTDWVKGKKYPRMDKVEMLADYFGVLKSDLIEEQPAEETKEPAMFDGLSENQKKLMQFAQTVPEEKAALILKVMQSIVEAD
jgi:transcriptional regulator with XRE-family HTH domain